MERCFPSLDAQNWSEEIDYQCPVCGSGTFIQDIIATETVTYREENVANRKIERVSLGKPPIVSVVCGGCEEKIVEDGELVVSERNRSVEEIRDIHHCLDQH